MQTLTVYETVLYSALLRLPKSMPYSAKLFRVQETLMELGISGIAHRRIGREGKRIMFLRDVSFFFYISLIHLNLKNKKKILVF